MPPRARSRRTAESMTLPYSNATAHSTSRMAPAVDSKVAALGRHGSMNSNDSSRSSTRIPTSPAELPAMTYPSGSSGPRALTYPSALMEPRAMTCPSGRVEWPARKRPIECSAQRSSWIPNGSAAPRASACSVRSARPAMTMSRSGPLRCRATSGPVVTRGRPACWTRRSRTSRHRYRATRSWNATEAPPATAARSASTCCSMRGLHYASDRAAKRSASGRFHGSRLSAAAPRSRSPRSIEGCSTARVEPIGCSAEKRARQVSCPVAALGSGCHRSSHARHQAPSARAAARDPAASGTPGASGPALAAAVPRPAAHPSAAQTASADPYPGQCPPRCHGSACPPAPAGRCRSGRFPYPCPAPIGPGLRHPRSASSCRRSSCRCLGPVSADGSRGRNNRGRPSSCPRTGGQHPSPADTPAARSGSDHTRSAGTSTDRTRSAGTGRVRTSTDRTTPSRRERGTGRSRPVGTRPGFRKHRTDRNDTSRTRTARRSRHSG